MIYRSAMFCRVICLLLVMLLTASMLYAQDDAPPRVVVSFSILGDVVQNVAGDAFQVETLIPAGADPHSFMPSPRDVVNIAEADVVFISGAGFEQNIIRTIANAGGTARLVTVSDCVPIRAMGEDAHDDDAYDDDAHDDDHDGHESEESINSPDSSEMSRIAAQCATHHEALDHLIAADEPDEHDGHDHSTSTMLHQTDCGSGEVHDAREDGHSHGLCDPHVWTNPDNVILWTYLIRDTLGEIDPANAEHYQRNADAYIAQIVDLNENRLKPLLQTVPEARRVLITNHETMGYFAEAYDFRIAATVIPGGATSSQLSAQDVIALIEFTRSEKIPAIFAENTINATVAEQIASESGAEFYTLLSDSLGTTPGTDSTYLEYLQYNAQIIAHALGGH